MLEQVVNLLKNNQLPQARLLCEQLSRSHKKNIDIWMLLSDIYQREGMFNKAINAYEKAIKLKTNYAPAHLSLAMLYHSLGNLIKAEPCYRQSLTFDHNQATAHYNLAGVLQGLGDLNDAINHYQEAILLKPDYVKAYANLGFILRQKGITKDAINNYKKALEFAPNMAEIHYNLGLSLLDIGETKTSELHLQQAIKLAPEYADAWAGLAALAFFNSKIEIAKSHYLKALNYQPKSVDILCGYNKVLISLGQLEQALQIAKDATQLEPNNVLALMAQGATLSMMGQLDEALNYCNKILKSDKKNEEAACLAASIEDKKGNKEKAYEHLTPLLQQKTPNVKAVINFASISQSLDLVDQAIKYMEQLLENSESIPISLRRKLYFTLGKAHDNQKHYDLAFKSFHAGNNLKKCNFSIKSMQQDVNKQIEAFPVNIKMQLKTSNCNSNRPIFIVGMPRSGTSLMEQIISNHHQVAAAGELPDINKLAVSISQTASSKKYYTEHIKQTTPAQLDLLAQRYLERLDNISTDALRITDKMPSNFMHLGLIQLLYPNARIIHCMRDPLDTCLSCYFQDFAQPHPWIYDLEDVASVYLEYQRLMSHWKSVLNIPILEVKYEELVDNQDAVSRTIIEFCELDWDDNCLDFHKSKRLVKTASFDQVRQPMYKHSISRWKNYEKHIGRLVSTLKKSALEQQ